MVSTTTSPRAALVAGVAAAIALHWLAVRRGRQRLAAVELGRHLERVRGRAAGPPPGRAMSAGRAGR